MLWPYLSEVRKMGLAEPRGRQVGRRQAPSPSSAVVAAQRAEAQEAFEDRTAALEAESRGGPPTREARRALALHAS